MDLSSVNRTELMFSVRTHKLLYCREELDITKQVLQYINAQKEKKQDQQD